MWEGVLLASVLSSETGLMTFFPTSSQVLFLTSQVGSLLTSLGGSPGPLQTTLGTTVEGALLSKTLPTTLDIKPDF